MKSRPKVTVWLEPRGYGPQVTPTSKPLRIYEVVKTQNTLDPQVGEQLEPSHIHKLIGTGVTVNIKS